ncbi:MAG TPA: TonB-dependent receptor [Saprospiraceae bacterium]|nr:TonB-dependent receptor [Saprospiraceae bacterium]
MKNIYLYFIKIIILLAPGIINAQMNAAGPVSGGTIKGSVADSLSGENLGYVSVSLQRKNFSKILNGAITDDKGKFSLEGVAPGKYVLRFVFVGYETKTVDNIEITNSDPTRNIGSIPLRPSSSLLKEVEVNARKTLIEQQIDRLVYNVDRDKGAVNQSLNELMRKVPMVQVDAEGNLSLRGSRNIQVLINGKPSGVFASNMADALRSIPAEQVSRVEVITMPSARYDAEGTAGIINIITKKKQIEGYNGTVNVAGSNIQNNTSASLNLRTAKVGLNSMIGLNGMLPMDLHNSLIRNSTTETGSTTLAQQGAATAGRIAATALIGVDYDLNSRHSFSSSLRWSGNRVYADGLIHINQETNSGSHTETNVFDRTIDNKRRDLNFEWTNDYRRTFNKPQQQWSASMQWTHLRNHLDYTLYERTVSSQEILLAENARNLALNDEFTAQTDYSQPLRSNIQLETGAKHILRSIGSDATYQEWENDRSGFYPNPERTQQLDYTQHISAAYLETRFQWHNKWSFRIGNRLEHTLNRIQNHAHIHDDYLTWTPGASMSFTFQNTATLTGSYSRRIQRPGISQLNPFANAADRLNVTLGNPYLRPELTDIFDLSFAMPFKGGFLNGSTFYYRNHDVIEKLTTTGTDGVASSIYSNLGSSWLAGANAYLTYQLTGIWSVRGGGNFNYFETDNSLNISGVGNHGIQFNTFVMSGLEFKNGFSAEMLAAYAAPQLSVQGTTRAFYTLQTTFSQPVWHKKGAVTLVVVNPFRHDVVYGTTLEGPGFSQSKNTYVPFRMVSVGFSYRFGKAGALNQMTKKKSVKNTDVKEAEKEQL